MITDNTTSTFQTMSMKQCFTISTDRGIADIIREYSLFIMTMSTNFPFTLTNLKRIIFSKNHTNYIARLNMLIQ